MRLNARRFAELALCAALFLSGLIFMPHAQHVFWAPEIFSARLLAPLALLLLLAFPQASAPGPERLKTGLWLLALVITCWTLSAALSFRPDLAARELAQWLAAPLVFAAAWSLGSDEASRSKLVFFIMAAGLCQALYGMLQSAGAEPALAQALGPHAFGFDQLNWAVTFGGRAGAFFGNPNFLGGHLAMLLPLALALALDPSCKGRASGLRFVAAAVIASGLVVTETRGAWLGAALGVALLLGICAKRMPGLIAAKRKGLAALGAAAALALGLFLAGHAQNLGRLSGAFSGDEEISRRLTLMRCSLALAFQHPLLGVGPGNFRIFFPSVQASGLVPGSRPYIESEHAHNDILQMAADAGPPAALLYGALIAWLGLALWRGLSQGDEKKSLLIAGILCSLLALQLHGLANFPFLIAPTQMTAWCLAALGLRLAAVPSSSAAAAPAPWKKFALAAGIPIFLFSAYDAGRALMTDGLWWVAQGEASLGNLGSSEPLISKSLQLDFGEDRLWHLDADTLSKDQKGPEAAEAWKQTLVLNPHDDLARVALGKAYLNSGDYAEAEGTLAPAAQEAPNLGGVWEPLAAALFMQQKFDAALAAYDQAAAHGLSTAEMLENKSAVLGSLGRYNEALSALDQAEALSPGRAKNSVNRAISHFKMGQAVAARADLREALRRDPNDAQAKALIKVIH
jgi:tetratricopeptide (TPR) repeat protein